MRRGHRFLASTLGNLAAAGAGRGLRSARRSGVEDEEPLGTIRGNVEWVSGTGGSRIYTESFPGSDPRGGTVVLTHGWCLTEAAWHHQKRDLGRGRHTVVTWDLPGHGRSTGGADGASLELATDALAAVLRRHEGRPILLVGHSLGGVVTLAGLARGLSADVRGAILVSTPLMHLAASAAGSWLGAGLETRLLARAMRSAVESRLTERALSASAGRDRGDLAYRIVRVGFGRDVPASHVRFVRDLIASVPPAVRAETYRTMTGRDLRPLLPSVRVPVLVVIGTRDRVVNPEESRALGRALPLARTLELDGVGHAAFLEDPVRFNDEVRRCADALLLERGQP